LDSLTLRPLDFFGDFLNNSFTGFSRRFFRWIFLLDSHAVSLLCILSFFLLLILLLFLSLFLLLFLSPILLLDSHAEFASWIRLLDSLTDSLAVSCADSLFVSLTVSLTDSLCLLSLFLSPILSLDSLAGFPCWICSPILLLFLSLIISLILLLDSPTGFTCWICSPFLSLFLFPILSPILLLILLLDSRADSFTRFSRRIHLLDLPAGFAHWILSLISFTRFSPWIHSLDSLSHHSIRLLGSLAIFAFDLLKILPLVLHYSQHYSTGYLGGCSYWITSPNAIFAAFPMCWYISMDSIARQFSKDISCI